MYEAFVLGSIYDLFGTSFFIAIREKFEIRLIKIEDFTNFENKLEISFEAKVFF